MSTSVEVTYHRSSNDTEEDVRNAYSTTVHNLIVYINGGALGLLQVVTNKSPTNEAHRGAMIMCFWFFNLIYVTLRVIEVKLWNKTDIRSFVGHVSHLFGALAALMLISLISPSFTLFAAPLWLVWFLVIMHVSFSEIVFPENSAQAEDSPV
ncbi:hypothetical protein N665_1161s0007 [Sinapis alba]|nr:hypothetical protein N665_1161s0007 [Sinapis alba]